MWALLGPPTLILGLLLATLLLVILNPVMMYRQWRYRKMPGTQSALLPPLLGDMSRVMKEGSPIVIQELSRLLGPVFRLHLGRTMFVCLTDPAHVRLVGYRSIDRAMNSVMLRGEIKTLIEQDLVSVRGHQWSTVRTAWQPAFSPATLPNYLPLMQRSANTLVEVLTGAAGKGAPIDVHWALGCMTLQAVGSSAFGVDFRSFEMEANGSGGDGGKGGGVDDDGYGAELTHACRDIFATLSLKGGGIWGQINAMVPELHVVWLHLAYAFPDAAFRRKLAARRKLLSTARGLIADWQAHHIQEAEATATVTEAAAAATTVSEAAAPPAAPAAAAAAPAAGSGGQPGVPGSSGAGGGGLRGWLLRRRRNNGRGNAAAGAAAGGDGGSSSVGGPDSASSPPSMAAPRSPQADSPAESVAGVPASATVRTKPGGAPAVAAGSFLDVLLRARSRSTGEALTDLQIIAQAQIFILAGYETTSTALAFALHCISSHPEVEARVVAEIEGVLGPWQGGADVNTPLSEDTLAKLEYLTAVISEVLRFHPPVNATSRNLKEAVTLGGHHLPAGTGCLLSLYSLHRDPGLWECPHEFRPERFLPGSTVHPNAYVPFGLGARLCIGYKFALQEMKVALVQLYRAMTFELAPGQQPLQITYGVTATPKGGLWVTPRLRERPSAS
ncbi:hypothetical protein FOA52_007837 [Chlamydomonas sp. UWO 241]|nr:hypothetical protein FOA52_007837 [Chlamydomonas sp. UWO 241]